MKSIAPFLLSFLYPFLNISQTNLAEYDKLFESLTLTGALMFAIYFLNKKLENTEAKAEEGRKNFMKKFDNEVKQFDEEISYYREEVKVKEKKAQQLVDEVKEAIYKQGQLHAQIIELTIKNKRLEDENTRFRENKIQGMEN
ncbi:hypothetical protein [Flammeovirga sp. OC4]|uniref:hypothetical protein n=1 Tax=Flammeovirga sp. OC4 TaxID=1382345 RepID=UPI0005C4B867|nr:hypothetical protein [Flammeovirga sp. OC4]